MYPPGDEGGDTGLVEYPVYLDLITEEGVFRPRLTLSAAVPEGKELRLTRGFTHIF